jgi:hypothetical protein
MSGRMNFFLKRRKVRIAPYLTECEILNSIPEVLTKRIILSQVNGIYDPLGLESPFIIRAKMILRKLSTLSLDWDAHIPDVERKDWIEFFTQLFKMERVKNSIQSFLSTSGIWASQSRDNVLNFLKIILARIMNGDSRPNGS